MPDYAGLDREYLVSGTRMAQAAVAVTRKRGGEPVRAHDWVRDVLREAGAVPAGEGGQWTTSQIAGALEGFHVQIRTMFGLMRGEVAEPDDAAADLHATLTRMAALRESGDAVVLEESITSGTPLQTAEDEAAAIATCDPELNAMLTVAACLEGLSGYVVRKRVLDYITSRFVTEPPF